MHPILLEIFGYKLHTYGALMGLGFLVAMQLLFRRGKFEGISETDLNQCVLFAFIFGILGARLLYIWISNPISYLRDPLEIIKIWKGGLVFFGGFIMAMISIGVYSRIKKLSVMQIFDLITPTLVIAHALGRLGCFMAGCCYGERCDLPWAITFTHPEGVGLKHIALHPTQIYSGLFLLGLFFTLIFIRRVKRFHGMVFLSYIMIYSVGRSIIETFRGDFRGFWMGLSTSQIISGLTFFIGLGVLLYMRSKIKTTKLEPA